jgi:hypothetical protein
MEADWEAATNITEENTNAAVSWEYLTL